MDDCPRGAPLPHMVISGNGITCLCYNRDWVSMKIPSPRIIHNCGVLSYTASLSGPFTITNCRCHKVVTLNIGRVLVPFTSHSTVTLKWKKDLPQCDLNRRDYMHKQIITPSSSVRYSSKRVTRTQSLSDRDNSDWATRTVWMDTPGCDTYPCRLGSLFVLGHTGLVSLAPDRPLIWFFLTCP